MCSSPSVTLRSGSRRSSVVRRVDLGAQLAELDTDRFDTPAQTITVAACGDRVDALQDQRCGRSSLAAKKAEALREIAFARFSSALSRFNRFSLAAFSEVTSGRWPGSTSGWRPH